MKLSVSVTLLALAAVAHGARIGMVERSLLADNGTVPSYNVTTQFIEATSLANITNTTIFSPSDEAWQILLPPGVTTDILLALAQTNATFQAIVEDLLTDIIVNGTHLSSEFPAAYTALSGTSLVVNGTTGNWTVTARSSQNPDQPNVADLTSLNNMWMGNIIHVAENIREAYNHTNATTARRLTEVW